MVVPKDYKQPPIAVVIDVFRAFATAAHLLARNPSHYYLTSRCEVVHRLMAKHPEALLVGKPEVGSCTRYDFPNSPTRSYEHPVEGRVVIHRTEAGARGVLSAAHSQRVLATGFPTVGATRRLIESADHQNVVLLPMGHEGKKPSIEDDLCAEYIRKPFPIEDHLPALRSGSGKYFFTNDQTQYPREDFERCLTVDQFDFAIEAEVCGDFAELFRRDPNV